MDKVLLELKSFKDLVFGIFLMIMLIGTGYTLALKPEKFDAEFVWGAIVVIVILSAINIIW